MDTQLYDNYRALQSFKIHEPLWGKAIPRRVLRSVVEAMDAVAQSLWHRLSLGNLLKLFQEGWALACSTLLIYRQNRPVGNLVGA